MARQIDNILKYKYYLIAIIIGSVYALSIARLYKIQIIDNNKYIDIAANQYVKNNIDDFDRGRIYFSKYKTDPALVADIEDRQVDRDGKNITIKTRKYLLDNIGAKVIGFVGYDENNNRVGRYGVEKYYDSILQRDNSKYYVNPFAEVFGDYKKGDNIDTSRQGDLVLTLDIEVQKYVYNVLGKVKEKWNSDQIGAIVMDTTNGEIVAMEELPTFDANNFATYNDANIYRNNSISSMYEMGSIIKPVTMASALDDGAITSKTQYDDVGKKMISGELVSNYDGVARGRVYVQEILNQSLNIGIAFVVGELGIKSFQKYFKAFDIGVETGIDLPSEASGLVTNLDSNVLLDNVTAGFGQGIAITPMQTVRALAALGNGGYLVNPHVVKKIKYDDGTSVDTAQEEDIRVIKKETSEEISRMLTIVVDDYLAKGVYKNDKYSVAAKTGTAEIPSKDGGYYKDRYLHSIFAYFPAYHPKYIVFLYQINPKGAPYASQTLSEPLFDIIHYLINYFEIQPDR